MFRADRLKKLRKEAGLIQADVAAKLNLKRESYTRYETGDIQPPSDMVSNLAKIFDVSTDYLLGNADNPLPQKDYIITPEIALMILAEKSDLSEESQKDLLKQLELLKMRDKMRKMNEEVSEELRPRLN